MKCMLAILAENIGRRLIEWAARQVPVAPSVLEARKRLTGARHP